MITIFGTKEIPQVQSVIDSLSILGGDFEVVDFDENKNFVYQISNEASRKVEYNGFDIDESKLIWKANKFICSHFGDSEEWANKFTEMHFKRITCNNILAVQHCPIVNSLSSASFCQNKLAQLELAKRIGFKIPNTIISNNNREISSWKMERQAIIKALGDPHVPYFNEGIKQRAISTSSLDEIYLTEHKSKIEPFPNFIQSNIQKKYEYRTVFIFDKTFTFRVDPNQHPIMQTDYRNGGLMVDYIPCELPEKIENMIRNYAKECGLFSGCFDLIEDKEGDYIFLEVNPEGIWGLHDDILEGKISKYLANSLLQIYSNL